MGIDAQFVDLMTSTIGVRNVLSLSTDGYGTRTYTTEIPVKARIENAQRIVKSHEGRDVVSPMTVYTPPYDNTPAHAALTIGPTAKLSFPAGTFPLVTSSSAFFPPILVVNGHQGEDGTLMYFEIALG